MNIKTFFSHSPYSKSCDEHDAIPLDWEAFYASLDPTTRAVVDAYEASIRDQAVMDAFDASLTDTIDQERSALLNLEKKFRDLVLEVQELLEVQPPRVDPESAYCQMDLAPGVQDTMDEQLNLEKRFRDLMAIRSKRRCLTVTIESFADSFQALLEQPANAEDILEWKTFERGLLGIPH